MVGYRLFMGMTLLILFSRNAHADVESVSFAGINAMGLRAPNGSVLTGNGVTIGQVEETRVAVRGFDSDANSNAFVIPIESRIKNGSLSSPNVDIGEHSIQ